MHVIRRTTYSSLRLRKSGEFNTVKPYRQQSGVGLIEILVAVVILAIGFLATARMQVAGLRYSQSAYFESQAYFMAGDMLARMRANVAGVKAGDYDNLSTGAGIANPGCTAKLCSPSEIADQDLYDWSRHLHDPEASASFVPLLPGSTDVRAQGSVSKLDGGQYSVAIVWADEHANAQGRGALRVDLIVEM